MPPLEFLLTAACLWAVLVLLAWRFLVPMLRRGPGGDAVTGLMWRGVRLYCRVVHRAVFDGLAELRDQQRPMPGQAPGLIVVANHTSEVDPLLIQSACRFRVRWLMAADMMIPQLDWLWRRERVIPVVRNAAGLHRQALSAPIHEAIRHLRNGGVVGVFPEARILQPRGEIRPFYTGVGVLAARTGAPVLLVWINGTPDTPNIARSFITPSRSRVRFIELIDFTGWECRRDPTAIVQHLRKRLSQVSGWPLNDIPLCEQPTAGSRKSKAEGGRQSSQVRRSDLRPLISDL
jgi:1-acyl-sn-glycerol-3-phosphate acyltransferase